MQKIKHFNYTQKLLLYLASAFIFSYFAGFTMGDDGMRHIAFAAHSDVMKSWGDVFPHSLFMTTYDPWHVWHAILKWYLQFFSYKQVHIAVNTTSLFVLMLLMDYLLEKYSKTDLGVLGLIFVLYIIFLSMNRYVNMRPDLLSGLYLMAALVVLKRWWALFLLTLIYAPTYYLFFLYTGSIGLVLLVLKDYRPFVAVLVASIMGFGLHFYLDGMDFIITVKYLLTDQSLRAGLSVGEGQPLFEFLALFNYSVLALIVGTIVAWLIYKNYYYFKRQPIALLLAITSVLWIGQSRYLYLLLPLMLLYVLSEIKPIVKIVFSRHILYYLFRGWHIMKSARNHPVFYLIVIPYTILMLGLSINLDSMKLAQEFKTKRYFNDKKFDNKRVLINTLTNDIYAGLYQNPTIKFVPSCSIGWFDDSNSSMKDIYVRMMKNEGINEKELKILLDYIKADYYIHTFSASEQTLSQDKLIQIGLIPERIIDKRMIYRYTPK